MGRTQLLEGASPASQVFAELKTTEKAAEPVPEMADPMPIVVVPLLVTVTFMVEVVPWVMVPKASVVGEATTVAAPVPESGTTGLAPPLVVRVRLAVYGPTALGAN